MPAARWLPRSLVAAGALVVLAALASEAVTGGWPPQYGALQILLAAAGFALLAHGVEARTAEGRAALEAWWREPGRLREAAAKYVAVAAQLLLLLVVIREFQIENEVFWGAIARLAAGGFAIHALTPPPWRLWLFLLLGLGGVHVVFGGADGLWLIGIGIGLVGLCHLPVAFGLRVALVLAVGAGLAWLRVHDLDAPWSRGIWPILGSMFMFRLVVYLYDLRHTTEKPSVARALSYFFLQPNVVFPLFPVVDYAAYRRHYYDAEAFGIYQRGVEWVLRGVLQLVLYRFIYQYLTLAPADVTTPADLGRYLVANFGLYIRVSGQFHVITGLLHLFGFNLPLTHNRYFLSASFTDFWRRINIYWKDFMLKVVFYPAYFRLKRRGETAALVLGTLLVFFVTWLLHSYQWFWLLGEFPVTGPDTLFWGSIGLLLIVNSLIEARRGRRRELAPKGWTLNGYLPVALRTAGTFAAICLLWSLWTSPTLGDWVGLLGFSAGAGGGRLWGLLPLAAAALAGAMAIGAGVSWAASRWRPSGPASFGRRAGWSLAAIAAVLVLGRPEVAPRLGERAGAVVASVRTNELNRQDATLLQRGYYENLMGVSRFNSQLWEVYMRRPVDFEELTTTPAARRRSDFLLMELVPSQRIVFHGNLLTINRWGMRDRDYAMEKAPGTFRVALIGQSTGMGWGVGDDETFEGLVERRLNRERAGRPHARYEILNLSIPAYMPLQQLGALDTAFAFTPDALLLLGFDATERHTAQDLVKYVQAGIHVPYDTIRALAEAAARGAASPTDAERRLRPQVEPILTWIYGEIARRCRERGVRPIWMYIPDLDPLGTPEEKAMLFRVARGAGFDVVDASAYFAGENPSALRVSEPDHHPNARGHRLLARELFDGFAANPALLTPPRAVTSPR